MRTLLHLVLAAGAVAAFGANCVSATPPATPPNLVLGSGFNSTHSGDYALHYSAISTTQLQPAVAQRYGVLRSSNRALVNVALRKGRAADSQAVAAALTVSATNQAGQQQTVRLREVREGETLYYLGEARIEERDTLRFEIEAVPADGGAAMRAVFVQEFWPAVRGR